MLLELARCRGEPPASGVLIETGSNQIRSGSWNSPRAADVGNKAWMTGIHRLVEHDPAQVIDEAVHRHRFVWDRKDDGVGDLRDLIERLDYLNDGDPATTDDLGVTGIWLMPINDAPSFRAIPAMIYNLLPPELVGLIGGPDQPVEDDVPLPSDGQGTVLNVATPATIVASPPVRRWSSSTTYCGLIGPSGCWS